MVISFPVAGRQRHQQFQLAWAGSSFPESSLSQSWLARLAQLVQLDADAAEKALFSLLTSPSLLQRMGRSASARAKELFAEDVVMDQYEALFAELEQRRLAAPAEAGTGRPMPASLDPVQAFQVYPSHKSQIFCWQRTSLGSLWTVCQKFVRGSSALMAPS